ncbi:hypothetical protein H2203_007564 [Taxawa tesnikishii (nom. ined.)]|nr:hypothetical protein H2203_007564 [Dothideales sp. JES 119]
MAAILTLMTSLRIWYHKRMLERRRAAKNYHVVPGDEVDDERDLELGETHGEHESQGEQETSVIPAGQTNVTEELDNWDENADDWDDAEPATTDSADGEGQKTPGSSTDEPMDTKKGTIEHGLLS